ncbi:MAG TPA: dsRBD fold-containing protein, partial [Citricoccus sp.]
AHAQLTTTAGTTLEGFGRARRNPVDRDVPEIGEELAAARALRDLADRLLNATSDDLSSIEHQKIHLYK